MIYSYANEKGLKLNIFFTVIDLHETGAMWQKVRVRISCLLFMILNAAYIFFFQTKTHDSDRSESNLIWVWMELNIKNIKVICAHYKNTHTSTGGRLSPPNKSWWMLCIERIIFSSIHCLLFISAWFFAARFGKKVVVCLRVVSVKSGFELCLLIC